jgi:hypothetical protein
VKITTIVGKTRIAAGAMMMMMMHMYMYKICQNEDKPSFCSTLGVNLDST